MVPFLSCSERYYKNYLQFFLEEVDKKSAVGAIQEYIFSNPENDMLNR